MLPLLLATFLCVLFPMVAAGADIERPPAGSPLRAELLDVLRSRLEGELGRPIEFVVDDIRVGGGWAFIFARPQRPGGGKIDYRITRFAVDFNAGMFSDGTAVLLKQTPAGWLIFDFSIGATDIPWVTWGEGLALPKGLLPNVDN